jgi:hypothetical protein
MADSAPCSRLPAAAWVLLATLGMLTPRPARAEVPALQLQALSQQTPGGCSGAPELDARIAEELKQLTGRSLPQRPPAPVNPTLSPAEPVQVFGGYIEPLDEDAWRARLWLKDAGKTRVAVRDVYYRSRERLTAELPEDAAALILLPDWSRTAAALPQYCLDKARAAYPEDACDPFLPPPRCGVPFDCTLPNQEPRCPAGPACGVAGRPPCPPPPPLCRVRDWRLGTGIAALVLGGVAVAAGGLGQAAAGQATAPALASYLAGGALLGAGTGLVVHWRLRAKSAPCK